MLHFKNKGGKWAYLRTKEPTKYQKALKMDGWKLIGQKEKTPRLKDIGRGYMTEIPF